MSGHAPSLVTDLHPEGAQELLLQNELQSCKALGCNHLEGEGRGRWGEKEAAGEHAQESGAMATQRPGTHHDVPEEGSRSGVAAILQPKPPLSIEMGEEQGKLVMLH